jgi:GT2 family glycosyltransferase
MIVSSLKHVDLLYALFLGRLAENNFVRKENIGRPALEIAKVAIGSKEFAESVVERFLLYQQLPHHGLPLRLLPEMLQLISEAGLAPPRPGILVADWQAVLGYVLSTEPCRGFLDEHGESGRLLREGLSGIAPTSTISADRGASQQEPPLASEPEIAAGVEIIANTICRGWVVDRSDPDALLYIRVRLNGRTVKTVAADEFRRDVQERYGGAGRAGFTIRLDLLPDAPYLSRGDIELTELSRGAIVLPNYRVEFCPFPAIRVEAELRETLVEVRDCLDRLQSPSFPEVKGRSRHALPAAVQQLRARVAQSNPAPAVDTLSDLLGLLNRLEQRLPRLEHGQSWALPFYGAVRPLVEIVVPAWPVANPTRFSIIIIDDGRELGAAEATLASLLAQTYRPHEVCLLACCGEPAVLTSPEPVEIVRPAEGQSVNAAVNGLVAETTGSHIVLLNSGEALAPEALAWFAVAIDRVGAPIIYTDAEMVPWPSTRMAGLQPQFRSAFDYDLLLQRNYIGDMFCIERQAYITLDGLSCEPALDSRHDLLLRAYARFGRIAFAHVPLVVVRSRTCPAPDQEPSSSQRTVQRHLDSIDSGAQALRHQDAFGRVVTDALRIDWPEDTRSRLSVIISTRDSADMVFASISSLRRHAAAWDRLEILVVVNGKLKPHLRAAFAEIENVFDQVSIIYHRVDFNWAEVNNTAAREHAGGELLLFLNDDMICLTDNWDGRLRSQLARDEVGVIGGRLLYPNGTLQHAGIAFDEGAMTAHEAMGDGADDGLYLDRTLLVHQVGAVTGALLACRRSLFDRLRGFDSQRYTVTSGDADFCVRTRLVNKSVIYDPFLTWIHYESVSRGSDALDSRKLMRAAAEHERWRSRFSEIELVDLSVNPHLARSARPFCTFHRPQREEIERWLTAQREVVQRLKNPGAKPSTC